MPVPRPTPQPPSLRPTTDTEETVRADLFTLLGAEAPQSRPSESDDEAPATLPDAGPVRSRPPANLLAEASRETAGPLQQGPVRSQPPTNSLAEASRETAGPVPQGLPPIRRPQDTLPFFGEASPRPPSLPPPSAAPRPSVLPTRTVPEPNNVRIARAMHAAEFGDAPLAVRLAAARNGGPDAIAALCTDEARVVHEALLVRPDFAPSHRAILARFIGSGTLPALVTRAGCTVDAPTLLDRLIVALAGHRATPAAVLARLAELPRTRKDAMIRDLIGIHPSTPSDVRAFLGALG